MNRCPHTEKPAVARCVVCGTTVCHECRKHYKARNYCENCWPRKKKKKVKKPKVPGLKSPTLAFLLSVVPGLGQMYVGAQLRGMAIMAATIYCLANLEQIPPPIPVFVALFAAWEARNAAFKKNDRLLPRPGGKPRSASEADWMLWIGTALLAALYLFVPGEYGVTVEPWAVWIGFVVAFGVSRMLGRTQKAATKTVVETGVEDVSQAQ